MWCGLACFCFLQNIFISLVICSPYVLDYRWILAENMNSSTAALVSPSIAVLASGFSSVFRDICLLSNLVLFFLKPSSILFIILVLCSSYFGHTSRTCSASSLPVPQSQLGYSVSHILCMFTFNLLCPVISLIQLTVPICPPVLYSC